MKRALLGIVYLISTCIGAPALAAENWTCSYESASSPAKRPQEAKFSIDGDVLEWKQEVAIPAQPPEVKISTVSFRHHILINNQLGVVAALAQSQDFERPDAVPKLLSANVILLDRRNGDL